MNLSQVDDGDIIEQEEDSDSFVAYYADVDKNTDRPPIYNADLGLAIEKLRDGFTVENLWNIKT